MLDPGSGEEADVPEGGSRAQKLGFEQVLGFASDASEGD